MRVTATQFRKDLFRLIDRVLAGEGLEVSYKGSILRVSPGVASSKLARAKRQDTLLCDPEVIVHSDKALIGKIESEWHKDWGKL